MKARRLVRPVICFHSSRGNSLTVSRRKRASRKECKSGCIGCGKCQRACPAQAITVRNFVARIDYDKCIGCQKCVDECPVHVIELLPHAASARAGS